MTQQTNITSGVRTHPLTTARVFLYDLDRLVPTGLSDAWVDSWLSAPLGGQPLMRRILEPLVGLPVSELCLESSGTAERLACLLRHEPCFGLDGLARVASDLDPDASVATVLLPVAGIPRVDLTPFLEHAGDGPSDGAAGFAPTANGRPLLVLPPGFDVGPVLDSLRQSTEMSWAPGSTACPWVMGPPTISLPVNTPEALLAVARAMLESPPEAWNRAGNVHQGVLVGPRAQVRAVPSRPYLPGRPYAAIGEESRIDRGSHLGTGAIIGRRCLIAPRTRLENCLVLDDTHVAPGESVRNEIRWRGERIPRTQSPPQRGKDGGGPPPSTEALMRQIERNDVVMVTGGAGFIGARLVRHLVLDLEVTVVNLDALTYAGNIENLGAVHEHNRHHFVHGDIGDRDLVRDLLAAHRPRAVMHLAAESHVDRSIDGPGVFMRTNVDGTLSLLEASLEYWRGLEGRDQDDFRFLHVSTDEVYGTLGSTGTFSESSPYAPNSPYAASKAASDHLVRAWHRTYGLPVLTTHASNNYGPGQYPEKLIPLAVARAMRGESIPVYGNGGNVRDWLHVDDHCRALSQVLACGCVGRTYNIGGGEERSVLDVVDSICGILDDVRPSDAPFARRIEFVEDRPGHDLRYAIDDTRIRSELGWSPRHEFESGLRETVTQLLQEAERSDATDRPLRAGRRRGLARGARPTVRSGLVLRGVA